MLIAGNTKAMRELMEIFQMPKNTKSFIIRGAVGDLVEIELTYYPEDTSLVAEEASTDD